MKPRVLLALVSIFRTTVARAIPSSGQTNLSASSGHGTVVNHSKPYYLQTKYWLNASAEYKYFQEPGNDEVHAHYDSRFFKEPVPKEQHSQTLTHIIHSYFKLFNGNNLETWIAHGTQLGWWWNGKIMPWDLDIDTRVSEATLLRLADDFNGTEAHYNTTNPDAELSYLLDINPWARQRDRGTGANVIDTRWIGMQTGLYIDITGLSQLNKEKPNEWGCKNNQNYLMDDIYPLRETFFEGVAAKVPYRYEAVLRDEYQDKALTEIHYNHYTWNPDLEEWVFDGPGEESEKEGRKETISSRSRLLCAA